jgi:hypothetical protein
VSICRIGKLTVQQVTEKSCTELIVVKKPFLEQGIMSCCWDVVEVLQQRTSNCQQHMLQMLARQLTI